MYDYAISVLKHEISVLQGQMMSCAEDCRDGVTDVKAGLVDICAVQNRVLDCEDAIELLVGVADSLKSGSSDSDNSDLGRRFEMEEEAYK